MPNPSELRRLCELSTDAFGEMVATAASAMGLPPAAARAAAQNAPMLQKMLASASENDLKAICDRLGSKQTAEILSKLPPTAGKG